MTNTDDRQHRSILQRIAHRMMLEGGLVRDLPIQVLAKLDGAHGPAIQAEESTRDLRNLLWCSIDYDDSRDLDQLTVAEAMPAGASKILVAIEAHAGRGPKSSGRPGPCRFTPKPTLVRISFPTT